VKGEHLRIEAAPPGAVVLWIYRKWNCAYVGGDLIMYVVGSPVYRSVSLPTREDAEERAELWLTALKALDDLARSSRN